MTSVTRTNGLAASQGYIYTPGAKAFRMQIKTAGGAAVNLANEDDAVNEVCEAVVMELNPLMYQFDGGPNGDIHLIMDITADAEDMALRIRNLGTTVGPNNIDVSGTQCGLARNNGLGGISISPGTMLPE